MRKRSAENDFVLLWSALVVMIVLFDFMAGYGKP